MRVLVMLVAEGIARADELFPVVIIEIGASCDGREAVELGGPALCGALRQVGGEFVRVTGR